MVVCISGNQGCFWVCSILERLSALESIRGRTAVEMAGLGIAMDKSSGAKKKPVAQGKTF
jgi:hypothetical protein